MNLHHVEGSSRSGDGNGEEGVVDREDEGAKHDDHDGDVDHHHHHHHPYGNMPMMLMAW